MTILRVGLSYQNAQPVMGSTLPLPIRVLDAEGSVIAEGVASHQEPATFSIPEELGQTFVRLTWPSGKTETRKVQPEPDGHCEIQFDDRALGHHEWSSWALPRLNENSPLLRRDGGVTSRIDRFDRVWMRLWKFQDHHWQRDRFRPTQRLRSEAALQLDLALEATPYLFQLGGPKVPWRLISLPGDGRCRILITPKDSSDPRAEPLKVVVTGFRPEAETLLEFLSRDSLRAARAIAGFRPLAIQLLQEKVNDPLSATAAAYFLLRTQTWDRVPERWFDNLLNFFPWIPDSALIRCVMLIRSGLKATQDENRAVELLKLAMDRGLPVFSEGHLLIQEAGLLLGSLHNFETDELFPRLRRLAASQSWTGSAFSFWGEGPEIPTPESKVGAHGMAIPTKRPRAPREYMKHPSQGISIEGDSIPVPLRFEFDTMHHQLPDMVVGAGEPGVVRKSKSKIFKRPATSLEDDDLEFIGDFT